MENVVSTGPQWTQDEAVNYECARECITDLVGIYSGAIADEKTSASPNQQKIKALMADRSALIRKRMSLRLEHHEHIAEIRAKYGAMIRGHRAEAQRQAA